MEKPDPSSPAAPDQDTAEFAVNDTAEYEYKVVDDWENDEDGEERETVEDLRASRASDPDSFSQ